VVGGDNYIGDSILRQVNASTSSQTQMGIWDTYAQRGLTYDPVEDVFYIGAGSTT